MRRPDVAADLSAETFAHALESRGRYDPDRGPAIAWLFGIARHVLANSVAAGRVEDRARRRLQLEPLLLSDATLAEVEALADGGALLADLPDEQAAAIRSRVLDERSYPEIAADLGCSQAVVRQRVSRGLAQLRHHLDPKDIAT